MPTVIIEDEDGDRYARELREAFPGVEVVPVRTVDALMPLLADLSGAEVLMTKGASMRAEILDSLPDLGWVQALIAGVDRFVPALSKRRGVLLTSMRGIHGPQMSEAVITQMLALSRDVARSVRNQDARRWAPWRSRLLRGKTVAVVGLGVSGQEVARLCRCFGMRVIGVSRSTEPTESCDEVRPYADFPAVAAEADFVVLLSAYTEETHHLVDAPVLAAMKPSAFLVNYSRGSVVDEKALIDALSAGTIAGAALDVFTTEPLPEESPLWGMANVLVTSHLGGRTDEYPDQALPVIRHNLQSYLEGDADGMVNRIEMTA